MTKILLGLCMFLLVACAGNRAVEPRENVAVQPAADQEVSQNQAPAESQAVAKKEVPVEEPKPAQEYVPMSKCRPTMKLPSPPPTILLSWKF